MSNRIELGITKEFYKELRRYLQSFVQFYETDKNKGLIINCLELEDFIEQTTFIDTDKLKNVHPDDLIFVYPEMDNG